MRYNAGNGGVQLSVNLISQLEEEGPTRLYCILIERTPSLIEYYPLFEFTALVAEQLS